MISCRKKQGPLLTFPGAQENRLLNKKRSEGTKKTALAQLKKDSGYCARKKRLTARNGENKYLLTLHFDDTRPFASRLNNFACAAITSSATCPRALYDP